MSSDDPFRYEILDSLPFAVFVLKVGPDGVPRYAAYNAESERQSGKAREEMVGRSVVEIYGAEIAAPTFEKHKAVAQTRQPLVYDWTAPAADRSHHLRTTLTPVTDDAGDLIEIVGAVKNITLEDSIAQAGLLSEAAASELNDFIGMAAHDLRTPMRNIESLVDLLKDDLAETDDRRARLIEMLGDVAKKSFGMITDILSATVSMQAEPETGTFALHSLVEDIMRTISPENLTALDGPRGWMRGDKRVVQLTLHNLLDNAFKHSGERKPALTIEVVNLADQRVEITVRDNGEGFADPALVFLAGDKLRVESGFGLFGVRRLILKRGGSIDAKNRKDGNGAEIIVTLPGSFQAEGSILAAHG